MRSLQVFFLLLIGGILIGSCRNKAVEYNNNLVKIQQEVLPKVEEFAKNWSEKADSSNLQNILPEATKMVMLLNQKIAEVNSLPSFQNGQDLKNAIIAQFEFQKNMCFKLGRLGDSSITTEEKTSIDDEFLKTGALADSITRRVIEAQKEFAKKNHFTLQNK